MPVGAVIIGKYSLRGAGRERKRNVGAYERRSVGGKRREDGEGGERDGERDDIRVSARRVVQVARKTMPVGAVVVAMKLLAVQCIRAKPLTTYVQVSIWHP